MKKCFLRVVLAFSVCFSVFACSAMPPSTRSGDAKSEDIFAVIENAVGNIAGNSVFLAELRLKTDAGSSEYWEESVADQLPSQPVAVIQLMTRTGIPVERMCPREVIEDALSVEQYTIWKQQAVAALDSFIMKDLAEEAVRKACLREIQKSLTAGSAGK